MNSNNVTAKTKTSLVPLPIKLKGKNTTHNSKSNITNNAGNPQTRIYLLFGYCMGKVYVTYTTENVNHGNWN